jgi:hypothetical protein
MVRPGVDMHKLVEFLQKEVFANASKVDPAIAQEACANLIDATIRFKHEDTWVTYSSIFGKVIPALLPKKWQTSVERREHGSSGDNWGNDEVFAFVHESERAGIVPVDLNADYQYGTKNHLYTGHALAKKWHGRPIDVALQMFTMIGPLAFFYMLGRAIKQGLDGEDGGGGSKKHH